MKQTMINYQKQEKNDEFFTPAYAIKPILKYLKPKSIIWCPFDNNQSNYLKVLQNNGHKVHISCIEYDKDFLKCFKNGTDIVIETEVFSNINYIISNPPYSIKNQILTKLYELEIPFAMLMPLTTLETNFRNQLFKKHGIELLIFDKRINFINNKSSNWFNTSYFCWNVLPQKIIFTKLKKD